MKKTKADFINTDRNYGIDILRIISMIFVVILHGLGHGGILANLKSASVCYKGVWILEIVAYCAVDVFALISGYVYYQKGKIENKYRNLFRIWLEVVFYGLVCFAIVSFLSKDYLNKENLFRSLFPVINNSYWYFTAYTGIFILAPIIISGIDNLSMNFLKNKMWVIIFVFCVFSFVTDIYNFQNGYSFAWLLIMFTIGVILKKSDFLTNLKKSHLLLLIAMLYIFTITYKFYGLEFNIFNIKITKNIFVSYLSPTIVGVSIFLLRFFSQLNIPKRLRKTISFFATSSFSIYLLNDNYLIRDYFLKNRFSYLAFSNNLFKIYYTILFFSIAFSLIAVCVDKIRIFLFKIIEMKKEE